MRIALCGEPRSGKDTVAVLLGKEYVRMAFGDYMKYEYFKANPHMVCKPKDREDMIAWSQPQVEKDNLIWVRPLEQYFIHMYSYGERDFVITDLRQPHEEKWCRENGFHIVRVHAQENRRIIRAQHLGEELGTDLPYEVPADFHIYNDGSLGDLRKSINKLLQVLESYDKIKSVTQEVNKL